MISIIIPTFNRSEQLAQTLQGLCAVETPTHLFEIIVVDNGSTDATKQVVKQYQQERRNISIRYEYDSIPGLLTGRHKGAQVSKGDILTFIDDDVVVDPQWLNTIIETMNTQKDITFLTGPNIPLYESTPPEWLHEFWSETPYGGKMCAWLSLLDLGNKPIEIDPSYVWGLNFTLRKAAFIELGGFHPDNIPKQFQQFQGDGETGLAIKGRELGKKALYHPGVKLHHQIPTSRLTYTYFDNRAFYQGVCRSYTALRRAHGLYATPAPKTAQPLFKRLIKRISKHLKARFTEEPKVSLALRFQQQNDAGFNFHQQAFAANEHVRNWVLKEHYFDYQLPTP